MKLGEYEYCVYDTVCTVYRIRENLDSTVEVISGPEEGYRHNTDAILFTSEGSELPYPFHIDLYEKVTEMMEKREAKK